MTGPNATTTDTEALRALLPADIAARVQSLRQAGGVVTVVADAGGLSALAREGLEAQIKTALSHAGEVRVGLMADRGEAAQSVAAQSVAAPVAAPVALGPLIIAVGSGKGGVGKSTLSANLAVALARGGWRVGLVDADIYGPSQPRLLANEGQKPKAHDSKMFPVPSAFGVSVLSMGHLIEPGKAIAWRGPMVSGALSQLIDAWWGDTQVLIVDLPPGTGDIQLTMIQKHKPVGAVIVSTPQDLALIDATRAIQLFETAGVPIIGLVENMAGYICPHCGEASDPFGHGGAEAKAREMGLPFLGRIPLDLAIRTASDAGQPPAATDSPQGAAFAAIAAGVGDWLLNRA